MLPQALTNKLLRGGMHLYKILLLLLLVFSGFMACEKPLSTDTKSGDITCTEYSVYSSAKKIYDLAWSPDGSQIVFVWESNAIDFNKFSPSGDTLGFINRLYWEVESSSIAVSPDEQYIIYRSYNEYTNPVQDNRYLYSIMQDTSRIINDILPTFVHGIKWSFDSDLIYFIHHENLRPIIKSITPDGELVWSVTLDSTSDCLSYSVSPDKQSIVWSGKQTTIKPYQLWLYTPGNGQQQLFTDDSIHFQYPSWSPDCNNIAYIKYDARTRNRNIYIYSLENKVSRPVAPGITISNPVTWSNDGQTIYFTGSQKDLPHTQGLWKYSLNDDTTTLLCSKNYNIIHINSDGSFYTMNSNFVFRFLNYSVAEKRVTTFSPEMKKIISSPTWSPDGDNLVFSLDKKLYRLSGAGGNPVSLEIGNPVNQNNPDYSPDGLLIAFDYGSDIYTVSPDGGQLNMVSSAYSYGSNPHWSRDGKYIACMRGNSNIDSLIVYKYSDNSLTRVKSWPGTCTAISWSNPYPNLGSYLLLATAKDRFFTDQENELKVLHFDSNKIFYLVGPGGSLNKEVKDNISACWAPDGETIAWIQRQDYPDLNYTLNIARILTDLQ